jgi:general secretion pathway protein D
MAVESEGPGMVASDVPPPMGYSPGDTFELVQLKYADVSEIVGLLSQGGSVKSNDLFIPREPAFGSNSLTGNSYNPGPSTQAPGSDDTPLGQSIDAGMAVDRRLNAIWLRGSPEYIGRMKAMIAAIDVPLDSVVLETQFVELTESGARNIGIDFTNANGQIGLFTFHSGEAILPGIPAQGCDSFGENCSGHVTSVGLQAAIYAQVTKGNGRIVSKPRIAAQSGSTAKIITGDALPILTAITLSGVNGVSQQVQYVNVGVTLQIAPRVSNDGFVSSHVFCVVSSVTGFSQGYPTISQREAETSATVRDGDSFVIGGLSQEDTINNKSKVPLLGDLPLIGQAFRTDKSTRSKTELYIVVTPHIVHRVGVATASAQPRGSFDVQRVPTVTVPAGSPVEQPR